MKLDQRALCDAVLLRIYPPGPTWLLQPAFEERPEIPGRDEVEDEWRGGPLTYAEANLELNQAAILLPSRSERAPP